ncbi:MAG TPA: long-chain fatty acid--CoA ligase [Steroidobacteraceae bacterium]|nr:long-chain fatty acid--CoA ligase [Steroidobacteraceae bacterium]
MRRAELGAGNEIAPMLGLMQNHPLLISSLIEHAALTHPHAEVVSRTPEGELRRHGYAAIATRAGQVAGVLSALGVTEGTRIGTLAWNTHRHLELLYGVSGIGAVLHTVNPRLYPEQIEYIINHAGDRYLLFDLSFLPLIERLAPRLESVSTFIALTDREHMPRTSPIDLLCYEEWIASVPALRRWPRFDENLASSMCYTSGTTGHPKGVLFSHRSTVLHAMATCMVDALGVSATDSVLLATPMFHANGWGVPYAAALAGASLILPGAALDGASVYELLRREGATAVAGVPTVWLMLQQHVLTHGLHPRDELQLERIFTGGAAVPRSLVEFFETEFNARVVHAWGMTETSPLGTVCRPLRKHRAASRGEWLELRLKQGRPLFGVEVKVSGPQGEVCPRDGRSAGRLLVRGPWVASAYYGSEHGAALDADGWFDTGDIATIDAEGYVQITDRAKDVIKSGGEWISSIELENAAMSHPAVAEAAAIGVPDPLWQERPLLVVVRRSDQRLTDQELLGFLAGKLVKWWLPEKIVFVRELPHTATGKLHKKTLREQYARGELAV